MREDDRRAIVWALEACICIGVLVWALLLSGCTPDMQMARDATDEVQRQGWELDAVVMEKCTLPAEAVPSLPLEQRAPEVQRLKDLGCPLAWQAQTDLSTAHGAMYALVTAYTAGQCVATIARDVPLRCSIPKTLALMGDAAVRLEAAVRRIEQRSAGQ